MSDILTFISNAWHGDTSVLLYLPLVLSVVLLFFSQVMALVLRSGFMNRFVGRAIELTTVDEGREADRYLKAVGETDGNESV